MIETQEQFDVIIEGFGPLVCQAEMCQPDPEDAVAMADVTHECNHKYRRQVMVCDKHLTMLKTGLIRCRFCHKTLSPVRVFPF